MIDIILFFFSFIFVFGLLVLVHEFGHFIAAKIAGVKVIEFGFGFPPNIFKKKIGETVYSINAIPIGGFVNLLGEDGSGNKDPKSFSNKPKTIRAGIISAGVTMNLILAWIIFTGLYVFGFSPIVPGAENHIGTKEHIYLERIESNSPAEKAGILKNDEILEIDGQRLKNSNEFIEGLKNKANKEVSLKVIRGNEEKSFKVIPFEDTIQGEKISRIGVAILTQTKTDNIFLAPLAGFGEAYRLAKLTVFGLADFFGKLLFLNLSEGAVGPVGIAVISNEMRQLGVTFLLQFLAILSISLALLNIMPIPALDGGHLFLLFIEKTRGKEMSLNLRKILTIAGFGFMISLFVIITVRDLSRFGVFDYLKNLLGI